MSLFMGLVWQDTFLSVALFQIGLLQANGVFLRHPLKCGKTRWYTDRRKSDLLNLLY